MRGIYPHPYWEEGIIRVDTDKLEEAHTRANAITEILLAGEVEPLPDEVLAILEQHTTAINTSRIGTMRLEIADAMQPPFLPSDALNLGSALVNLVKFSNGEAAELLATDEMIAAQFRVMGERFQP